MVAKTFQGLEDVLRDELISLGAENVELGRRMVSARHCASSNLLRNSQLPIPMSCTT